LIQLERRLNFRYTGPYRLKWRCHEMQAWFPSGVMFLHVRDELKVKLTFTGALLHSGYLLFWWRVAWREHYPGLRLGDSELQSLSPVESSSTTGKGDRTRPAPAILLALHFFRMTLGTHIRSNTGCWGSWCRYALITSIWPNAQLMSCAIHAFTHARQAGMSRELVPGKCTQLYLGQNCQA